MRLESSQQIINTAEANTIEAMAPDTTEAMAPDTTDAMAPDTTDAMAPDIAEVMATDKGFCALDEGTFSEESFYYLLMGHGSRRERVLFAMCQLVQICFMFIIVLPAFGSDLAQGYLDKVSMDDDQERLALFPAKSCHILSYNILVTQFRKCVLSPVSK